MHALPPWPRYWTKSRTRAFLSVSIAATIALLAPGKSLEMASRKGRQPYRDPRPAARIESRQNETYDCSNDETLLYSHNPHTNIGTKYENEIIPCPYRPGIPDRLSASVLDT